MKELNHSITFLPKGSIHLHNIDFRKTKLYSYICTVWWENIQQFPTGVIINVMVLCVCVFNGLCYICLTAVVMNFGIDIQNKHLCFLTSETGWWAVHDDRQIERAQHTACHRQLFIHQAWRDEVIHDSRKYLNAGLSQYGADSDSWLAYSGFQPVWHIRPQLRPETRFTALPVAGLPGQAAAGLR